jgi:hypothetical protein
MTNQNNNSQLVKPNVFFYQQRGYMRHIKRFKKQPDQVPASLRGFLNAKIVSNSQIKNRFRVDSARNENEDEDVSLVVKLTELAAQAQLNLDTQRNNQKEIISLNSKISLLSFVNPFDFTDHRLRVLKQITEPTISALQEYLNRFDSVKMSPVLYGPVVYKMHSDWTDLTNDCIYDVSPRWHTKLAYELTIRKANDSKIDSKKTGNHLTKLEASNSNYLAIENANAANINPSSMSSHNKTKQSKDGKPQRLLPLSSHSKGKYSSVVRDVNTSFVVNHIEQKQALPTQGMSFSVSATLGIQFSKGSVAKLPTVASSMPNQQIVQQQQQSPQIVSQSVLDLSKHSPNPLGGWLVNFQLSNVKSNQKGWVTHTDDLENLPIDLERRAIKALRNSYRSM